MSSKSNTKTYITLAVLSAAGLALTACSSTKHERTDYSTMGYAYEPAMAEPSGAAYQQQTTTTTSSSQQAQAQPQQQQTVAAGSGDVTIPLQEEQVTIGKQAISEPVTIRKVVTTETVSQPVQLRKETLVIEHNRNAGASGGTVSGAPFEEKTMTINLQQEQPLIQKQTVVKDNVTIRRGSSESQATISQQVRKENVEVDKPASGNVTLQGDFRQINEAAGAQPAKSDPAPQQQQQQQQQQQENK